jgi:hypothetical protein
VHVRAGWNDDILLHETCPDEFCFLLVAASIDFGQRGSGFALVDNITYEEGKVNHRGALKDFSHIIIAGVYTAAALG